jgi:L-aspartate oxidase
LTTRDGPAHQSTVAIHTDVLVIGSGIAGLSAALECATWADVVVVTKDRLPEGSSRYAQGGIASVWSPEDSFEAHAEDTMAAGAGLCRPDVVDTVVREGPARVRDLIARGVTFDAGANGDQYDLGREGGHSRRRILHALDATGHEIMRVLGDAARAAPRLRVVENHVAIDLLLSRDGNTATCWGAYVLDRAAGRVRRIVARATLLCTGGSGKVYLYTSNPDVATGDGLAMAYRAGASIANMEFFQFHPTCLYHPAAKSFLLTEALRGEGAVLRRPDGERFMPAYHPDAELAPRDVVARAIDSEMKMHGFDSVYLDISHRDEAWVRERFPTVHARCAELGMDLARQPVPVVPAAHYQCGGVLTNVHAETTLPRLYAAGEVACTGLHGANRLASNSLLEALVFAHRAAQRLAVVLAHDTRAAPEIAPWDPGTATDSTESVVVSQDWDEIRRFMWNYVGIVRSDRRLERARQRIRLLQDEIRAYYWNVLPTSDLIELRNIATVAELIIYGARSRRESRGLHTTVDHPLPSDALRHETVLRIGEGGVPEIQPPRAWPSVPAARDPNASPD